MKTGVFNNFSGFKLKIVTPTAQSYAKIGKVQNENLGYGKLLLPLPT